MLLKIGEFSRLSQVTVKTLHHYDDIGLFKPAQIDTFTSYRYYSVEQLPRIHRIMALKELGLSLDQIALMLNDDLSTEEIRGMLRLQQAQAQQRLREEQLRLHQIEFRLRMLEMEGKLPELEVIIKEVTAFRALTLRTTMPYISLVPFGVEIEQALAQHQIEPSGAVTEIHYEEEFKFDFLDVEFAIPVDDTPVEVVPLTTFGELRLKTVPGLAQAATHIVRGVSNPQHFAEAKTLLERWIVDNNYRLCGTHRAVHLHGPREHAEYADWITEIQHEIALVEEVYKRRATCV